MHVDDLIELLAAVLHLEVHRHYRHVADSIELLHHLNELQPLSLYSFDSGRYIDCEVVVCYDEVHVAHGALL
ncbi:hypothetical protein D3C79_948220 [compost metagenome]